MLKRINRLKSRGDFKRTLSGQRLCVSDCFVLYGLPFRTPPSSFAVGCDREKLAAQPLQPKIGFVVSKKVHKSAVRRNRVKRQLRELVRLLLLSERRTNYLGYRTLVFILRPGSLNANFQTFGDRLNRCLQNL